MLGGRFDEHPWGITEATVIVEDRDVSPITAPARTLRGHRRALPDQGFSRRQVHVLARLDAAKLDLKAPLVHRTDVDFRVA